MGEVIDDPIIIDVEVYDQNGHHIETFTDSYSINRPVAPPDPWFVNRFRGQNVGLVCWRRSKGTYRTIALEWLGDMCLVGLGDHTFYVIPIHLDNTLGETHQYLTPFPFSYRMGVLKIGHLYPDVS